MSEQAANNLHREALDASLIPDPIVVVPGYVSATYPHYDGLTPDHERNLQDAVMLQDRFDPKAGPQTRLSLVETGSHYTTYARLWDGGSFQQVHRLRVVDGEYLVSRRLASSIFVGSLLLFNAVGNISAFSDLVDRVGYELESHRQTELVPQTITVPGKPRQIGETVTAGSAAGSMAINPKAVRGFVAKLHKVETENGTIDSIAVVGYASDEDARVPNSIGNPTKANQILADGRSNQAAAELKKAGVDVSANKGRLVGQERVVDDKTLIKALETEAKRQGYPGLISAIQHANIGEVSDPNLLKAITDNFTGPKARGARLTYTATVPTTITDEIAPREVSVSDGTTPPPLPDFDFYGFIPLLPIRKRKVTTEDRPKLGWVGTERPVFMPKFVRETGDKVFIKVYDDGVEADGSLKADAVWHTDKFEYLLREPGRLQDMIRIDLHDNQENLRALRMLFVDTQPGEAERSAFTEELMRAARFNNGKLAEAVNTFMVYPSESAGIDHQNPSQVALGQQQQLSKNILGVYNPVLKLIEIVMPTTWTAEELSELFQSFYGPTGILNHELGHALERKNETYAYRKTKTIGGDRVYVISAKNRTNEIQTTIESLKPFDLADPLLSFDVKLRTLDQNDNEALLNDVRVGVDSKILASAQQIQIVNSQVLPRAHRAARYRPNLRRRQVSEEFADSFAGLAGKGIPLRSAGITTPKTKLLNGVTGVFSRWFLPSKPVQSLVERQAVAEPGSVPLQPVYKTKVVATQLDPRTDPLIGAQMIRARNANSRDGRQQVTYLAEVKYAHHHIETLEAKNV